MSMIINNYLASAIDSRTRVGMDKNIYTIQDHINKNYVRNKHCWAYGIDLSCVSPYAASQGDTPTGHGGGGCLVSPRHFLDAYHASSWNGTYRHLSMQNEVFDREIVNSVRISDTDVAVGTLDSDLPIDKIKPANVLPSGWDNYILSNGAGLPTLCTDQEEKALVQDISLLYPNHPLIWTMKPTSATRVPFYETKVNWDSANPLMLVFGSTPILLTCLTYGGAGGGFNHSYYRNEINNIMQATGSGYKLTEFNFKLYEPRNPPRTAV